MFSRNIHQQISPEKMVKKKVSELQNTSKVYPEVLVVVKKKSTDREKSLPHIWKRSREHPPTCQVFKQIRHHVSDTDSPRSQ